MENVTISVRIPKEVREELGRYKVKISEVVRRALEEEIRRRRREELERVAEELGDLLAKIPDERIVKSIREMRGSR
jgi:hypothetical protein